MKKTLIKILYICTGLLLASLVTFSGAILINASSITTPIPTKVPAQTNNTPSPGVETPSPSPGSTSIPTPIPTPNPFERYVLAVDKLKSESNYEFSGTINVKTALEGIELTFPIKFDIKVLNAHDRENYTMQLDYSTSILGISSIVSVYYKDGISYVSNTSIYGDNSYTTKVKTEKEIISAGSGISIDNVHIFGELSDEEFSKMMLNEAESCIIYSLTLTGEEAKKYLEKHLSTSTSPDDTPQQTPSYDSHPDNDTTDENVTSNQDNNNNLIGSIEKSQVENIEIAFAIDFDNNFTEFNIDFECIYENELFNRMNAKIKVHIEKIITDNSIIIEPPEDIDEYV